MDQYFTPKKDDFRTLRFSLDNYSPELLFIRMKGSFGGETKVKETLEGRALDFRNDGEKLEFIVGSKSIYELSLKEYYDRDTNGFAVMYERYNIVDGHEVMIYVDLEKDPYNPNLPEPKISVLRTVIDYQLIEIVFTGRIDLEFHSWWRKPDWKYWKVVKKKF